MTPHELKQWLIGRGVPAQCADLVSKGKLSPTNARTQTAAYAEARKLIFVLAGPTGAGKTVAAAEWLAQPGLRYGERASVFLRASAFASHFLADFDEVEKSNRCVLDGFGEEFLDEENWLKNRIGALLLQRVAAGRPTVLTTRLPGMRAMRERYGDEISARLTAVAMFAKVDALVVDDEVAGVVANGAEVGGEETLRQSKFATTPAADSWDAPAGLARGEREAWKSAAATADDGGFFWFRQVKGALELYVRNRAVGFVFVLGSHWRAVLVGAKGLGKALGKFESEEEAKNAVVAAERDGAK